jgi:hypothetical protein
VLVIVALASARSMANDRVVVTNWTTPRQALQRNHPGSMLSSASGSYPSAVARTAIEHEVFAAD